MIHVDLICSPEYLPRVKLLVKHLGLQKIKVKVHHSMPDNPNPRLIALPNRLEPMDLPEDSIALYFDKPESKITTTHVFHIPTWPARSSDHQVAELAALLKKPIPNRTKEQTREQTKTKESTEQRAAIKLNKDQHQTRAKPRDPAPRTAFIALAVVGFSLYLFSGQDEAPKESSRPIEDADHAIASTSSEANKEASATRDSSPTTTRANPSKREYKTDSGEDLSAAIPPRAPDAHREFSEGSLLVTTARMERCPTELFVPKFDPPLPSALAPSHAWCPAPPRCVAL